jgi:hypothetical protein
MRDPENPRRPVSPHLHLFAGIVAALLIGCSHDLSQLHPIPDDASPDGHHDATVDGDARDAANDADVVIIDVPFPDHPLPDVPVNDGCMQLGAPCSSNPSCCSGVCTPSGCGCPMGSSLCGNVCVDTSSDPMNCGACGTACLPGTDCSSGMCCPMGQAACGGTCMDTQSNVANCGACGRTCPPGAMCVMGMCTCPPGLSNCNGTCANTQSDPANCGTCGHACPGGTTCTMGVCCPPGGVICGPACVDTMSDAHNCGGCGHVCPTRFTCAHGACGHYVVTQASGGFIDACATPGVQNPVVPSQDDGTTATGLPLPFTFLLYGVPYTTFYPDTNGFMQLGESTNWSVYYLVSALPDPGHPRPAIFAYYHDLYQNSPMCYVTVGMPPSRQFVFESTGVTFYADRTVSLTYEIILNEVDQSIDIVYQSLGQGSVGPGDVSGANAMVGLQDEPGLNATVYEQNMAGTLAVGLRVHFAPAP